MKRGWEGNTYWSSKRITILCIAKSFLKFNSDSMKYVWVCGILPETKEFQNAITDSWELYVFLFLTQKVTKDHRG